jgi:uncharacterized protein
MNRTIEQRAIAGDPDAQFALARKFWRPGLPVSRQKMVDAVKWYREAARSGHREAQVALGQILLDQDFPFYEPLEGLDWITQAANSGDVNAQHFLGVQYAIGKLVARDAKKSAYWYRKASRSGHPSAQYNLAAMYWEGDGIKKNKDIARKLMRLAAAGGEIQAISLLADAYKTGEFGFPIEIAQSSYWTHKKEEKFNLE